METKGSSAISRSIYITDVPEIPRTIGMRLLNPSGWLPVCGPPRRGKRMASAAALA